MTNDQFPNDELLAFIRHSSFTHSSVISIGECRIRTCEGISHQIYSLTRLTASVTPRATNNSVRAATPRTDALQPPLSATTNHRSPFCKDRLGCMLRAALIHTPLANGASS